MKQITLCNGDVVLEFDEATHAYRVIKHPDPWFVGKHPPGVTSILKLIDKPALIQWAANCSVEYISNGYVKIRDEKGELEPTVFLSLCQEAKTAHRRL